MAKNRSISKMKHPNELTVYSEFLNKAGTLNFENLDQPMNGSILVSLDIEEPTDPYDTNSWKLHLCCSGNTGKNHEHNHFLLNMDQVKDLQGYLLKLLLLHGTVKRSKTKKG